jgi:hypothetical protein
VPPDPKIHVDKCWLAQFTDTPCDGALVRAHLIKRQVLVKEIPLRANDAIADPRSWVPACGGPMGNGGHHGMLDHSRTLRIPIDKLPPGLWELCSEHGLEWWLQLTYGGSRDANP